MRVLAEQMPDSYFLSTPEEMMSGHGELRRRVEHAEAHGDHPAVATKVTAFPERDFTEYAVCTRDRPGLFAMLSGVLAAAPPAEQDAMRVLAEQMPDSYFLSTPEEMMSGHGELRRRFERAEAQGDHPAVATKVTAFPERDFTEYAVCTRDRPGLFAMLSGVLAAHGMNILAARIDTSRDGVALDAFRVSHEGTDESIDRDRWERAERTLRGVLAGTQDVEELVRRSGRPSLLTKRRRPVPTRVEVHNDVSADYTVLDVYAADRVGLLFTITNCLYHLWIEIHLAKITTMVHEVLDVFYVSDPDGRKITDPERIAAIRDALVRALAPQRAASPSEPARAASG